MWEQLVVGLIVAGAALYLALRGIAARRRGDSCSGCASCSAGRPADDPAAGRAPELVQIEPPRRS